jgi:hypothetical protein
MYIKHYENSVGYMIGVCDAYYKSYDAAGLEPGDNK